MDEIKVSLTIKLPGAVMWSKEECLKTVQEVIKLKNGKKKKAIGLEALLEQEYNGELLKISIK